MTTAVASSFVSSLLLASPLIYFIFVLLLLTFPLESSGFNSIMDCKLQVSNRPRAAFPLEDCSAQSNKSLTSVTATTQISTKTTTKLQAASSSSTDDPTTLTAKSNNRRLPSLIVFDLDGCLWRPEMYELLYFSGGAGAPFTRSETYDQDGTLYTRKGEPVRLLGQVREVMRELYCETDTWGHTQIGISSRTDQPEWAMELLEKFTITTNTTTSAETPDSSFRLKDVIQGPIEIGGGSKAAHFQRISKKTGIAMEDILFFDNERGNCQDVSRLGVVVAYCPDGVTKKIWKKALEAFPVAAGQVVADENTFYGDGYQRTQW